jgi:Tol biopolymer transport system component
LIKGKQFFWDSWKGRILFILILFFAFNIARYIRTFGPIPSIEVWPENDNIVIFSAEIHTSPLTSKRGFYFLDLDNHRLRYWKSIDSNLSNYYFKSWAVQEQQMLVRGLSNSRYGYFLVDTNGDIVAEIASLGTPYMNSYLYYSTISPNAESIAIVENIEKGDIWNFYIQDIEGAIQQNLQTENYRYAFPTWSPDGQKLIFVRGPLGQNIRSIVRTDIAGNNQEIIFSNQNGIGYLAWSPDGKMIAFSESSGSYQDSLWIMNADGSNSRIILSPEMEWDTLYDLAWTPDGQHIVYVSQKGGHCSRDFVYRTLSCTSSLYMIDVNTTEVSRLTHRRFGLTQLVQIN